MDDYLFLDQWPRLNALEESSSFTFSAALNEDIIFSAEQPDDQSVMSRPLKQQKCSSTWDSSNLLNSNISNNKLATSKEEIISWSSSSSGFLVFDNNSSFEKKNHMLKPCQAAKRLLTNNIGCVSQAHEEHVLAERKRRERINERLISLSKLIPGLSKMDKATVLADAVKYIKKLQDKVKFLEEKMDKIKTMQSMVVVKRYEVYNCSSDQTIKSSSDDASRDSSITTNDSSLPEIEARICNKDVLITIHCKKKKRVLEKLVAEIERHLTVVNSSVMSFGDSALNVTVVAQMVEEFNMNMSQLVNNLHVALENL